MSDPQHVDDAIAQSRSNMSDRQKVETLRREMKSTMGYLVNARIELAISTKAKADAHIFAALQIADKALTATDK